ncbi:MAG: 4-hydroxy-3-methylbut-2-enyl diphosphate reductase [Puniceicoccales bacterium]|jgi:4-hydroxy-3-methylbut-2-enyl diphosphate reductase|nr:4-hydroxy-3-methylbut-2-enyl diphosphate reductase [Puniceicoccales bacterium]
MAEVSGFCGGVKRALGLAYDACRQCAGRVYVAGELVHNKEVMENVKAAGIKLLRDYDLKKITPEDALLIRAHGCPRGQWAKFHKLFNTVIDGTCPHVGRVSKMVECESEKGKYIIIIGDKSHPEVQTLASFAKDDKICIINSEEELDHLQDNLGQVLVIAQSTIDESSFRNFANKISKIYLHAEIKDTICGSSRRRQRAILNFKKKGIQAVVVVGGIHSNNTRTLVQIAQKIGLPAFHVETATDLPIQKLKTFKVIGVIGGASTDEETTKQMVANLLTLGNQMENPSH